MINFSIRELLDSLDGIIKNKSELINYDLDYEQLITEISCDSRKIIPNSIFMAIIGEFHDGHDFLQQVWDAKASVAIVTKINSNISLPQILVTNTKQALGLITNYLAKKWQKPRIAVTGSAGKTTTKFILNAVLQTNGQVLCAESSFNNDIGVPLTLFNAVDEQWAGIFEFGTNHPGEIEYLANLLDYDVAILTNISVAHIGNFASVDAIAEEKSTIFKGLKSNGTAIIWHESVYYDFLVNKIKAINASNTNSNKNIKILTFGFDKQADVYADNIEILAHTTKFILNYREQTIDITLPLLGKHQILNALAASAAALQLDIELPNIQDSLTKVKPVTKRMQPVKINENITVIDDSYNANPASVAASLDFLASLPGHKIFVLGDLGELGDLAQLEHEKIGKLAKKLNIDKLLAFGNFSKYTLQAFNNSYNQFADKQDLSNTLLEYITDYKHHNLPCTILIKGSNFMKMWEVTEYLKNKLTYSLKVEDN
jgi:UDP-N-acetylmuramoyl-tripeptide--D-alanyl-D-alanine ligase